MFLLLTKHTFGLWTKQLLSWMDKRFNDVKAAVANINLTSVTTAISTSEAHTATNITNAKQEILAALGSIDSYELLSDSELEDIVVDVVTVVAEDVENEATITIMREDKTPTQDELDATKLTWHDDSQNAYYTDITYNTTDHKNVYVKSGSDYLPVYTITSIS